MNFRLIQHNVVDSTSERAFASLTGGQARHGDVHIARAQTHGRGRLARTWQSPPDEGLYASIVLLPAPPPYRPTALTMATALALVEALCDLGLPPFGERAARLKWPNDVLVAGAKLCGILTECRGMDATHPHFVVGIGLNVRQLEFPTELRNEREVTSLALLGLDITLREALDAVLERLSTRLPQVRGHHRELADDYLLASGLRDRLVQVTCGGEQHTGVVCGLSITDGLELQVSGQAPQFFPLEFIQALVPQADP